MNAGDESETFPTPPIPPVLSPTDLTAGSGPGHFSYWVRRFFACNPFYLLSAALLLYGVYRVSVDADFLRREIPQLIFNSTSLQLYELLLVVTAIFLARRRIWYDSTLLVGLENLLVFVPFILVTQAILIDRESFWWVCGLGVGLAVVRWGSLKRFFAELHLPYRVLGLGFTLLALNVALAAIYRELQQTNKFGPWPTEGSQYEMAKYTWLLILPAALALGNLLPYAKEVGLLLPQRRWLHSAFFVLWIAATTVHVYCLDYVYGLKLQFAWIVPVLWMLAWTAYHRAGDLLRVRAQLPRNLLLTAPLLVSLLAAGSDSSRIFVSLAALNAGLLLAVCFVERDNRFARYLLSASVILLIAGLPLEWKEGVVPAVSHVSQASWLGLGALACGLLWMTLSRNPKVGVLAALILADAVIMLGPRPEAVHWGFQAGLVFLLLHSLRWCDFETRGVGTIRVLASVAWVLDSFIWMHSSDSLWLACVPGGVGLGGYMVIQWLRGEWDRFIVPVAAAAVVLSGPASLLLTTVQAAPRALLVVISSFLCFGLGTIAALTKHRWHSQGGN